MNSGFKYYLPMLYYTVLLIMYLLPNFTPLTFDICFQSYIIYTYVYSTCNILYTYVLASTAIKLLLNNYISYNYNNYMVSIRVCFSAIVLLQYILVILFWISHKCMYIFIFYLFYLNIKTMLYTKSYKLCLISLFLFFVLFVWRQQNITAY